MKREQIIEIAEKHGFMDGMSLYSDPSKIKESLYAAMAECADRLEQQPEVNHKMVDFVDSLAPITEYVDGDKIAHRFNGLTIPVIEFNEMRDKAKKWIQSQQPISEERINELATEYSTGHYTDTESIKQAYDDYYIGFKDAIKELL